MMTDHLYIEFIKDILVYYERQTFIKVNNSNFSYLYSKLTSIIQRLSLC